MNALQGCLLLSTALFVVGLVTTLSRSNGIRMLLGIELMLSAANLNFVAFWRFGAASAPAGGVIFVIFSMAVAAAEAAVGLALIIGIYRHQKNIRLEESTCLKG